MRASSTCLSFFGGGGRGQRNQGDGGLALGGRHLVSGVDGGGVGGAGGGRGRDVGLGHQDQAGRVDHAHATWTQPRGESLGHALRSALSLNAD